MTHFSSKWKIMQLHLKSCIPLLSIAAAIVTWMLAPSILPVYAGQRKPVINQEEGLQPILAKADITIEKKSLQNIYTLGKRFAVNGETVIVGIDGKEITIKKMLVPCDAEVFFEIINGVRTARRVNVKRVAAGASWQWASEKPK